MLDTIAKRFSQIAPAVDFWSLRLVSKSREMLAVRQNIPEPLVTQQSLGALVTIVDADGIGYAASSDLTRQGLARMCQQAQAWALQSKKHSLISGRQLAQLGFSGKYHSPVSISWREMGLDDKLSLLHQANHSLKGHDEIVDWGATLDYAAETTLITNSHNAYIYQKFHYLTAGLFAVANDGAETQRRTFGFDQPTQGGLEMLDNFSLTEEASRVGEEVITLLHAPNCPTGKRDLLLLPSQMALQIHESIGHPLELDRILGDERNYAGTSFVTLDMFGQYQYGSEPLNITFDPQQANEYASYAFDDEGTPAERKYLIRNGILQRPLGGTTSQLRAEMAGVANTRASDWNRAPIDRMANLNLEPGAYSLNDIIANIEQGVLMDTNRSWSIDDSRNKFQFGCEYARLIQDGELQQPVKNPNYRGISANFWRNLLRVGDDDSFQIMGVPTCGKGEPNQMIHVGHASPACLFTGVDIFGGDS